MIYFAHNGVDHGSAAEAVTHSSTEILLTVILVTTAVVVLMGAALWAVNRLAKAPVAIKKDRN